MTQIITTCKYGRVATSTYFEAKNGCLVGMGKNEHYDNIGKLIKIDTFETGVVLFLGGSEMKTKYKWYEKFNEFHMGRTLFIIGIILILLNFVHD